jgi:quercetin dioxygenase-like cupin family protein
MLAIAAHANGEPMQERTSPAAEQPTMVVTPLAAREAAPGPKEYFTGTVRVTSSFQPRGSSRTSGASVTFEPGARSAWHSHPLGQTLVVTAGTGWIQQAGGEKREIRAGDVIWTPPGVKHWHGATATSAMTHLAIQEALDGKVVEWMEKVSDEQYVGPTQPRQPEPARAGAFGVPPVRSPEVSADGAVTFRLRAPNAREVLVRGVAPEPIELQKDAQGVWSVTTAPLKPELYSYSFVVDGLTIPDPSNRRTRPAYHGVSESSVLVPGDDPWTPRPNVARGAVSRHSFRSAIAGDEREYLVYTPAGYDPKRPQPYPVLTSTRSPGSARSAGPTTCGR